VHLPREIMWNPNLMQEGNFIDVFLARHVPGTYAHHQEHRMLSCSIWFSAPSFWMGGGLESRCVGRVSHTTHAITLFHQVGIQRYSLSLILIISKAVISDNIYLTKYAISGNVKVLSCRCIEFALTRLFDDIPGCVFPTRDA